MFATVAINQIGRSQGSFVRFGSSFVRNSNYRSGSATKTSKPILIHCLRMSTEAAKLPPFVSFKPSSGDGSSGAIIVLQEWWGINDQIKEHAQNIANGTGCTTYVPDLYKGKLGLNAEEASHLMNNLDFKNAVDEIHLLCKEIRSDSADKKIGVTGFCMGGALTMATTALQTDEVPIQACAPFYGIPPEALCDVGVIPTKTPYQGHFGDLDPMEGFCDKPTVDAMEEKFKKSDAKFTFEVFRYEKEGHAFMNTDEFSVTQRKALNFPGDFDPETQKLAWSRLFDFMKKNLAA